LNHGASKVYATARKIEQIPDFGDTRVIKLELDIADSSQIQKAVEQAPDVQILLNNAGVLAVASVLAGDMHDLQRDMNVNYFGTLSVTRAFAPAIEKNGDGAIAIVSSIAGLVGMAGIGGYSASKAALSSAIQSMRAELKPKQIEVIGIFPGPIDTDMARPFEFPKTSAEETAENILRDIEAGKEDIFPDPMSAQVGETWLRDPKAVERQFASM